MPAIDPIVDELMKRGGSDLHLAVNQPPIARIRGELAPLRDVPFGGKELEDMLLELVTPAQRSRLAMELDLEFAVDFKNVARLRATYYVKHSGIAATFRVVPARVPALAEIGCPESLWRLADQRSGIVIIGGPAASGKTTVAASLLDHINKTRACHIVTIEDPIEFVHEPVRAQVTQREIGAHTPSFEAALRGVVRESPDVVFISELRSSSDAELAFRLACDGIFVVTTYAGNSVVGILERLVSSFPHTDQTRIRGLIGDSLAGVIVQHLLRSGDLKSRVAVHEILLNVGASATLIREGKTSGLTELMKSSAGQGMQTLDTALERLLGVSKITAETALERAIDRETFAHIVARLRPDLVNL